MKSPLQFFIILLCCYHFFSCDDDPAVSTHINLPPETGTKYSASEYPGKMVTIDTSKSKISLNWWGSDPDGEVVAYEFRWGLDSPWVSTEYTDSIFSLSLDGAFAVFDFYIRAVDNEGLRDPSPAKLRIPVENSPPEVRFNKSVLPNDTIFPHITFSWIASDIDGDETIKEFLWVLDDTNKTWNKLGSDTFSVTLQKDDGLSDSSHVFFLKAVDNAGFHSKIARFPDSCDTCWITRIPNGKILYVNDHVSLALDPFEEIKIYKYWIEKLGYKFNYLNTTPEVRNQQDLGAWLKMFDVVVWYTRNSDESRIRDYAKQIEIFKNAGGRLLLSIDQKFNYLDPDSNFYRIFPADTLNDSLPANSRGYNITRILAGTSIKALQPGYVPFTTDILISDCHSFVLNPKVHVPLFQLSKPLNPRYWAGNPIIASLQVDDVKRSKTIAFTVPMHSLTGDSAAFETNLREILVNEFGVNPD